MPDPNIFLGIVASVADLADVNPNGIKHIQLMVSIHFSLTGTQFIVMVLKLYLTILLIVLFYAIEFFITLY